MMDYTRFAIFMCMLLFIKRLNGVEWVTTVVVALLLPPAWHPGSEPEGFFPPIVITKKTKQNKKKGS